MDDVLTLSSSSPPTFDMPGVLSFYRLLAQASSLPCSSGAAALLSLVPSESIRFPFALDIVLPTSQDRSIKPPQRILAAYVLHALYASHDHLNPFYEHLLRLFESERTVVIKSRTFQLAGSSEVLSSPQEGDVGLQGVNEQFVWVLWKILKGEGEDLSPYSPDILSRATLPEHLRAPHLVLRNVQNLGPLPKPGDFHPAVSRNTSLTYPPTTLTYPTHSPLLEQGMSSLSLDDSSTSYFPPEWTRTRSTPTSLAYASQNIHDLPGKQSSLDSTSNGWRHEESPDGIYQNRHQAQTNFPYQPDVQSRRSELDATPSPDDLSPPRIVSSKDHRREALLRALCVEPPGSESAFQAPGRNEAPTPHWSDHNSQRTSGQKGETPRFVFDVSSGYDPSHDLRGLGIQHASPEYSRTTSSSPLSRVQPRILTAQNNSDLRTPGHQLDSYTSLFANAAPPYNTVSRVHPGPIERPKLAPSLSQNSTTLDTTPLALSASKSLNSQYITAGTYTHASRSPASETLPQGQRLAQNVHHLNVHPSAASLSRNPLRSPGVIGSGRPSKSTSPVSSETGEGGRPLNVGVIGNGRPSRRSPGALSDVTTDDVGMLARYAEQHKEGNKMDFGAIGRPKHGTREVGELLSEGWTDGVNLVQTGVVSDVTLVHPPARRIAMELNSNVRTEMPTVRTPSDAVQHRFPPASSIRQTGDVSSSTSATTETSNTDTTSLSALNQLDHSASTSPPPTAESATSQAPYTPSIGEVLETEEKARDELSRAIVLLLSARERVLTLSEQRTLLPCLPLLTRPLSLLRPGDLQPLVAKNPDIAAKLLVLLLDRDDEEAARVERVLRDIGKDDLSGLEPSQGSIGSAWSASAGAVNAVQTVAHLVTSTINLSSGSAGQDNFSPFGGREAREGYLEALRRLPPTMQSFNLIAKLLSPVSLGALTVAESSNDRDSPEVRVACLVREDVLGGLINGCVRWIEKAEEEERNGEVIDDRVAIYVSNLSRFYTSLLKHGLVSAESEVETAEIMSFALQFSKFEEARSLYSMLAAARA